MKRFQSLCCVFLIGLTFASKAGPVSELKTDETLVFFNTSAWLNTTTKQWHVPIHGWVFEPEQSKVRKALIASTFETAYDLIVTSDNQAIFDRRINTLLADNERGKHMVIRFADRSYAIPESTENGHFSTVLLIDQQILATANMEHTLNYQAVLAENDTRVFTGKVQLIKPHGLSIISDIDDTIKISEVTDRKQLIKHTFYEPFKVVPGMAQLYQKWLTTDGSLHFVSSSPWQLYPVLDEFITAANFPTADYALKSFRFKDQTLMNLFAKSTQTKPPQIKELLEKYPQRSFILIGDSGEYDPEIYARILQQYPNQIRKILIRNVTQEQIDNPRFQALVDQTGPAFWQLFSSTSEITYSIE